MDFDGRAPTAPGKERQQHRQERPRTARRQPAAAAAPRRSRRPKRRGTARCGRARPRGRVAGRALECAARGTAGRFPGTPVGGQRARRAAGSLMPDIAHEFNAIIALNEAMANEMVRVERVVGREGRMTERATLHEMRGGWGDQRRLHQRAHRRPGAADHRGRARHQRRRRGRLHAEDGAADRGAAGQGRVPAHRHHRQQHGRSAELVRRRGHARREGGRHRRQARRPGRGARRRRHLARSHRQREPARQQPDRAGAQHRRGHDVGRQGRPVEEDHRRRAAARCSS